MSRSVLSRAPRWLLFALFACAPLASGAQVTAPAGLPAGSVLYQTREVPGGGTRIGVVSAAYAVGQNGTAEPLAFGSISGLARALAVVSSGDALRLAGGRDVRSGWVAVEVGEGVPVLVEGVEVARGPVHLRMDPGAYTLSFGAGTEPAPVRVQARASLRVSGPTASAAAPTPASQLAPETVRSAPVASGTAPSLPTRAAAPAPRSSGMQSAPRDAAMRRLIATSPFARGQGGETTPDSPLAGWTMPVPPPKAIEDESAPVAAAPPPVAMRRSPIAAPEPRAAETRTPEAAGEMDLALCPAPEGADDKAATDELILAGTYPAARACIVRHITRVPDDLDAIELNTTLERIVIAERAMADETLTFLAALREQVEEAADEEDLKTLDTAANRLLSIFPGDLSTVRRLRAAHARTVTPADGEGVDFAYVPGASARLPNDLSTRNVTNPPALGFLLSEKEITNAQYVYFLNGIEESDNPFLVRKPENLALTRAEGWQPILGAENLPIVDVTWYGAEAYAKWIGGRLPTENEWEWAYRLGGGSDGSDANLGSGPRKIRDVDTSRPDHLGLHDMLGNVWEWLDGEAWGAQSRGAYTRRGVAGGSFSSPPATIHANLISTADALLPAGHIGFRVYMPASGDDASE